MTLVEPGRHCNVVLLTVGAVAPDLMPLPRVPPPRVPPRDATGRFGLETRARRQPASAVAILRDQLHGWIRVLPGLASCGGRGGGGAGEGG